MTAYSVGEVASIMRVSVDTARRWMDVGGLGARRDDRGHRVVEGRDLAKFAASIGEVPDPDAASAKSARNRIRGIVTEVVMSDVMARVEVQAGPNRMVSLISREAAEALDLAPGVVVVASVKSTDVMVEVADEPPPPPDLARRRGQTGPAAD